MLCPTCRYNLAGLPEHAESGGRLAVTCPECGRSVSPVESLRRRRPLLFTVMLILPWVLVSAFVMRTGSTMSDADAELTGTVLPWTAPTAAPISVTGGALLVAATRQAWSLRRRLALITILLTNAALLTIGWLVALACIFIGV